ncbi:VanZ like family protein [Mariprofundus micogutta]|uniref:VanZ like family protein n=1 Tax=Mariprofundus micogutta TaxID=1921010 RepID=A0A1L8CNT5_9PROT|nr:VanZ family protein [Mariprofundus micogutta]GAV20580.1 VanZ like family protein [Mariprofundus micogutta]
MNTVVFRTIWLFCLIAYCGLIYLLSDQPVLPVPLVFNMQDKLIHATAYAVMAWLCWHAGRAYMSKIVLLVATILFCAFFGASDEWHQSFVAGRDASIYDWLADVFGALLLTLALWKREVVVSNRK